jgi:hypothetical protein
MSLFARASWPGDHRDEIVAGALVAAVIVVLGYASGIGAPAPTTFDTAAPSTSPAPSASVSPSQGTASGYPGAPGGDTGAGSSGDSWAGGGGAGIPIASDTSSGDGHGGQETGGGNGGQMPMPGPSDSASHSPSPKPSPSPSPTPPDGCQKGEVHLVQPLLSGTLTSLTGPLDGLLGPDASGGTASPTPSPSSSPSSADLSSLCVGVAPSPSVLPEVLR